MPDSTVAMQVPTGIWLGSTPAERDAFFLDAGFDPNLPAVDNGTDPGFVRFKQLRVHETPMAAAAPTMQAGDDTRDFQPVSLLTGDNPITDEFGIAAPASFGAALPGAAAIAGRALKIIMGGGGGRIVAATWNALPPFARTVFIQAGIGIGSLIAFNGDIPFITLPGQGGDPETGIVGPVAPVTPVDIQIGGMMPTMGVSIIGSWNTNPANPALGVTFFRLSNGKLAVQNKKGAWKVWRPKKPIVLFSDGASDIKTMLRADAALNRQAKKLDKMLKRRAPRPKKAAPKTVIVESGPGNVVATRVA